MNRYTSLTPSKFDPLSLEEIMAVPLYKQKQYDALQQGILDSQNLLKLDPDKKHFDEANRIKNELDEKTNALSKQMAVTGDVVGNRNNVLALQKEYQDITSPLGKAGQINAINPLNQNEYNSYITNGTTMGHSPQKVKEHADTERMKYDEDPDLYDENGKLKPFKITELPPKYYSHLEIANDTFKNAKFDRNAVEKITGGVGVDEYGQYSFSEKTASDIKQNYPQLESVVNFIKDVLFNPNSDLAKSNKYNDITPQEALNDILNLHGVYKNYEETITEPSYTRTQSNGGSGKTKTKDDKEDNVTLYRDDREESELSINKKTYNEAKSEIQELYDTSPDDPNYDKNIADGLILETQLADINYKLDNDPIYQKLQFGINDIYSKINSLDIPEELKEAIKNDTDAFVSVDGQIVANGKKHNLTTLKLPFSKEYVEPFNKAKELLNQKSDLKKEKNEIADDITSKYKMPYVSYIVDKTNDTAGYWGNHTKQIADILIPDIMDGNKYKIDSVIMSNDGEIKKHNVRENTEAAVSLMDAFGAADDKNITRYIIQNENSEPMIEFAFTPKDGFELKNMDGFNPDTDGRVIFRVAIPNLGRNHDNQVTAIENLMISSLEKNGGYQGRELAEDMRAVSRYKDIKPSYDKFNFRHNEKLKQIIPAFEKVDGVNLRYDPEDHTYQFFVGTKNKENIIDNGIDIKWKDMLPNGLNEYDLKQLPSGLRDELMNSFIKNNKYRITDRKFYQLDYESRHKYLSEFLNENKDNIIKFSSKENAIRSFLDNDIRVND